VVEPLGLTAPAICLRLRRIDPNRVGGLANTRHHHPRSKIDTFRTILALLLQALELPRIEYPEGTTVAFEQD
jgi:hypothetical protein